MPQLTGDDKRVQSLPDLKDLIQNMYGNGAKDTEMYETCFLVVLRKQHRVRYEQTKTNCKKEWLNILPTR